MFLPLLPLLVGCGSKPAPVDPASVITVVYTSKGEGEIEPCG